MQIKINHRGTEFTEVERHRDIFSFSLRETVRLASLARSAARRADPFVEPSSPGSTKKNNYSVISVSHARHASKASRAGLW